MRSIQKKSGSAEKGRRDSFQSAEYPLLQLDAAHPRSMTVKLIPSGGCAFARAMTTGGLRVFNRRAAPDRNGNRQ
jgi:hypothetical protein